MKTILAALVALLPLGVMADTVPGASTQPGTIELTPAQRTELAQIKASQEKQAKAIEANTALTPAQKQVQLSVVNRVAQQQSEAVETVTVKP